MQFNSLPAQEFSEITGIINSDTLINCWFSGHKDSLYTYRPDEKILQQIIQSHFEDLSAELFLGTWCEDSYVVVPQIIKTLQLCNIPFSLTGVNREKKCPFNDDRCLAWDITNVPTLRVYRKEKLLGKIVEYPQNTIEGDLLNLLQSSEH
jgi:hypothetical protein